MQDDTRPKSVLRTYPHWFYIPAALVFLIFFLLPTALSFYFSLTRWTLFNATFIGLENYVTFLGDPMLMTGLRNTVIYAVLTSGLKVVISLPLAIVGTPVPACSSADDVIQPLVEVEKEVILAALEKTGGNKTEAARQLGITRKTLLAKLSR